MDTRNIPDDSGVRCAWKNSSAFVSTSLISARPSFAAASLTRSGARSTTRLASLERHMRRASLDAICEPSEIACFNKSPDFGDEVSDGCSGLATDLARRAAALRASEIGPLREARTWRNLEGLRIGCGSLLVDAGGKLVAGRLDGGLLFRQDGEHRLVALQLLQRAIKHFGSIDVEGCSDVLVAEQAALRRRFTASNPCLHALAPRSPRAAPRWWARSWRVG